MTIIRRIRTLRMLAGSSNSSRKLDSEVFLMPEGYRHDIQHPNQPLDSVGLRT